MSKLEIVKVGFKLTASLGAGLLASNMVSILTPANIKTGKKILIVIGGMVLADIVSSKASDHAGEMIDEFVNSYKEIIGQVQ